MTENTHPAQKFDKSFFLKGCFSISEPGHLPLCEGLKKRQISLGNQGVISMCEHSGEKVDWKKKMVPTELMQLHKLCDLSDLA